MCLSSSPSELVGWILVVCILLRVAKVYTVHVCEDRGRGENETLFGESWSYDIRGDGHSLVAVHLPLKSEPYSICLLWSTCSSSTHLTEAVIHALQHHLLVATVKKKCLKYSLRI